MTRATETPPSASPAATPERVAACADAGAGEPQPAGPQLWSDGRVEGSGPTATARRRPLRKFRQLPFKTRALLTTAGILLLILGIAGLFLPFLQGILFLILAAAVFSLASRRVYGWLHRAISARWPGFWTKIERFRTRVLWKYRR